jgi:hypothetical protein
MSNSKMRTRALGAALVGLIVTGIAMTPAAATQYLTGQYCGTPGAYGQYSASSDYSLKRASTAHTTGPTCGKYGVNAHYIATGGTGYWYGMQWGTYSRTQNPGYPVDKALHDTYASSVITTY